MDDGARKRTFRAALTEATEVELLGAAAADEGGVRAVAARQPDLVLVEASRPAVEGAKFVGRLRAVAPRVAVIAVASAEDRPRSLVARTLAADCYVDPDVATADLIGVLVDFARDWRKARAAASGA